MSRGPGAVQTAVLGVLVTQPVGFLRGWLTVRAVTQAIYPAPTRANLESVRRAAKMLERRGVAETGYLDHDVDVRAARVDRGEHLAYRRGHDGARRQLEVRLAVSVEQRDDENRHLRDLLDRLVSLDAQIDVAEGAEPGVIR